MDVNKNGKKASSKIAALMNVLVGREAKMAPQQMRSVGPILPQNSDSVSNFIFCERIFPKSLL